LSPQIHFLPEFQIHFASRLHRLFCALKPLPSFVSFVPLVVKKKRRFTTKDTTHTKGAETDPADLFADIFVIPFSV
jgi:hypothetical protein